MKRQTGVVVLGISYCLLVGDGGVSSVAVCGVVAACVAGGLFLKVL
ncbi:hypothetical protein SOVF_148820 [Spinacia oleracea]|nr:hypothetical protein SOVF_148820 [Spinacia oleracea]